MSEAEGYGIAELLPACTVPGMRVHYASFTTAGGSLNKMTTKTVIMGVIGDAKWSRETQVMAGKRD